MQDQVGPEPLASTARRTNQGTCVIPAVAILLRNARAEHSRAGFVRLCNGYRGHYPSGPSVAAVLNGRRLVTFGTAIGFLEPVKAAIATNGGHVCNKCTEILQYTVHLEGLGALLGHVSSLRGSGYGDVVDMIATASDLPMSVIEEMAKRRSVPLFTADKVWKACDTHLGAHARRFPLKPQFRSPNHCTPVSHADGRDAISDAYVKQFCAECAQ